jgi:transaldolase
LSTSLSDRMDGAIEDAQRRVCDCLRLDLSALWQWSVDSPRWERAYKAGARPQLLLWAGTETKDPMASDVFYINALAAPLTVRGMPESTLKAFADHGDFGTSMPADGGDCEAVLNRFTKAGIDIDELAAQLQDDGTAVFIKSWIEVMSKIAFKSAALVQSQW